MSFIDSPLARCEAMRQMVLTDGTQAECAREHDCPPGLKCPLCGYFVEATGIRKEAGGETPAAVSPLPH
jgi:hypothetical protein